MDSTARESASLKKMAQSRGRLGQVVVRVDLGRKLARDVARKVESEMEYPGQIKVQVIRETRAVEYAK